MYKIPILTVSLLSAYTPHVVLGTGMNCTCFFLWQLQMNKLQVPQGRSVFSQEELESQKMLMWQQLATLITPSIHSVVEFSKRVPSEYQCPAVFYTCPGVVVEVALCVSWSLCSQYLCSN